MAAKHHIQVANTWNAKWRINSMAKILVIDDDPHIRGLIVAILMQGGHEALEAKDGQEGISLFRANAPVLVITDILMPEKDGIETIRELRGDAFTGPIIAISGGGRFLGIVKKFGADLVLAKPFSPQDLIDAVGKLLSRNS